jgi:hypothetical protein
MTEPAGEPDAEKRGHLHQAPGQALATQVVVHHKDFMRIKYRLEKK